MCSRTAVRVISLRTLVRAWLRVSGWARSVMMWLMNTTLVRTATSMVTTSTSRAVKSYQQMIQNGCVHWKRAPSISCASTRGKNRSLWWSRTTQYMCRMRRVLDSLKNTAIPHAVNIARMRIIYRRIRYLRVRKIRIGGSNMRRWSTRLTKGLVPWWLN